MRPRRLAALAGALLGLATPAGAAPELQLALLQDGQSGIVALSDDVAVSPDGRHLYASGGSFVLALRKEADGRLTFVEEYLLNVPGVRIVAAPDGLGVLALASGGAGASVVSYLRNAADGKLTWVENEAANLSSSVYQLAPSRDGTRVYVTSPGQDGVVVYTRDAPAGTLAFAQRVRNTDAGVSGLLDPTELVVSPDDRHVYVAGFRREGSEFFPTLVLLRRESDGTLVFVESVEVGDLGAQVPTGLLITPDGSELLLLDGGQPVVAGSRVLRWTRDPADGRLSFVDAQPVAAPGFFTGTTTWFALRPDGERIFFGGLSSVPGIVTPVMAWSRDGSGILAPVAQVETGYITQSGVTSPDGRYVYTSTALGVRVLVPEPAGGGAAALAAVVLSRQAQRRRRRAPASARA